MRRLIVLLGVALLVAACGGSDDKHSTTPSTGGPLTTPAPVLVALHAYNVRLANSEESDNAFRVAIHSPATKLTVVMRGGLPSPNEVVQVCPAVDLDTHGTPSKCAAPADGEPVELDHGAGLEAIEVAQVGAGAGAPGGGDAVTIGEIEISYQPRDRSVSMRLPPIDVPLGASVCKDNSCNPFFEMTPFTAGPLTATASWQGGETAQLSVERGEIAAHGQSSTGTPYDVVATTSGGPGISVKGTLPRSESAVVVRNTGSTPLVGTTLTVTWA